MSDSKAFVSIDYKKCTRCGVCVSVCPFTVLVMGGNGPYLNPDKHCLKCLHCAAACPSDAVLYDGEQAAFPIPSPEHSHKPGLTGLEDPFSEDLAVHIKARRSYRHFSDTPVPQTLLESAAAAADFAPSAKNQHPTGWIIVNGKEKADQMMEYILDYIKETGLSPEILSEYEAGNNVVMGTAPTLILGYARDNAVNATQDTAIALCTMELFLQSKGVGTCWAGYLTRLSNAVPALKEYLKLPAGSSFYAALMAGYPQKESYRALPKRTKPASITWI